MIVKKSIEAMKVRVKGKSQTLKRPQDSFKTFESRYWGKYNVFSKTVAAYRSQSIKNKIKPMFFDPVSKKHDKTHVFVIPCHKHTIKPSFFIKKNDGGGRNINNKKTHET